MTTDSALAIYKQMILPLFDYSFFFLLISCNKTDREDLQVRQNNALRLCLDLRLNDRISHVEIHRRANMLAWSKDGVFNYYHYYIYIEMQILTFIMYNLGILELELERNLKL